MKTILLIRHAEATGQDAGAELTASGFAQASALADTLTNERTERIVSSPFLRALQTAEPLSARLGLSIVTDDRLIERVLCGEPRADWRDLLAASFDDLDACWPGGETSRAAMDRVGAVIREAMESDVQTTALVTHGCLLALALISMDDRYGFEDWQTLKCPDIFRVSARGKGTRISRWYRTK